MDFRFTSASSRAEKSRSRKLGRGKSDSLAFTIGRWSGLDRAQEHSEKEAAESFTCIQGTNCTGNDEGGSDPGRVGPAYFSTINHDL